jgi:hypothetical protein
VRELERLVVHIEEAIRHGTAPDEAHLRLGLILLDLRTADDARALDVCIGLKQIENWRRQVETLRLETNGLHAFASIR